MSWMVDFGGPGGPLKIWLEKKTTMGKDGFGAEPSIYPVTIVHARYNGTYEGGALGGAGWLCFPVAPHVLSEPEWQGWCDSDIECMQWWDKARDEGWPIGRGPSPAEAYASLIGQVCARAGLDPSGLSERATWSREELIARESPEERELREELTGGQPGDE